MSISYDEIAKTFLEKVTGFDLLNLPRPQGIETIDGYMKRAVIPFRRLCEYDLTAYDDVLREFTEDFTDEDAYEIVDIISEGMLIQWMKPYVYNQEILENTLSTKDYSQYSPATLLQRIGDAYKQVQKDYKQLLYEYSYAHGDLTDLHI